MSAFNSGRAVWTQRDQVQAYQFLRRRVVSALQSGDANDPVSPNRRVSIGTAVGVGCALLVAAAFGIYGVLRPDTAQDWRRPGQIVLEKESGAIFVLGTDALLHPVLNFASARLLTGAGARTVTVPARSLARAPRGLPVGIDDAPDSLPPPRALLGPKWTVCASVGSTGTGPSTPVTTLLMRGLTAGEPLGPDRAVIVVEDGTDDRYAVAGGRRFRISDAAAAVALGLDRTPPIPVAPTWLRTLPRGTDLAVLETPGSGRAGPRLGRLATRTGQVLVVSTLNGDRHYLVTDRALRSVSAIEAALLLAAASARAAYPVGAPAAIAVPAADLAGIQTATEPTADYPTGALTPARLASDQGALCVTGVGTDPVEVRIAVRDPLPRDARAVPTATADRSAADLVYLPPGTGVLVVSKAASTETLFFVSDRGIRYPLGDGDTARTLGFGAVAPVTVPAAVLTLLPAGPKLTRADAQRVANS